MYIKMAKWKPLKRCTVGVPSYNRFIAKENNRRLNGGGGVSLAQWEARQYGQTWSKDCDDWRVGR
jgi:hypothetical protein